MQALTYACIALIVIGVSLFFVSDKLSHYLYEKRLQEFRTNYANVSKNLDSLKSKLTYLDSQINKIEEKDNAIRTYAGMPIIDKDIRKLGVGGHLADVNFSDNLAPIINKELSILEMDVEKLSREVNLELTSYTSIYNKVQEDINRISKIPSIRPVEGGYLNSTFGYRNDPIDHVKRFHQGQDITVKSGTPVLSPADGVVKRAYYAGGFGNHIKLEHGSGYTTLFAHLSKINVKHGQIVKRGETIGYTGNTGRSTAPHLHYEIHHNGKPQNPLDYFFSESK
jgi:murein DD-endopeptidase MepM/ murein hydrolase activator NlpD